MAKRSAFVVFFLILISVLGSSIRSYAETVHERKMVYVVVDDSNSMAVRENRWPKARYAMEVLSGLLNSDDRLQFYYLNSFNKGWAVSALNSNWPADLSKEGIQDTMKQIVQNDKAPAGFGTPFSTVQAAFEDMLEESRLSDKYDKYWLVVFTDGQFAPDYEHTNIPIAVETLENEFRRFVSEPFGPEGDGILQVIYCTIGSGSEKLVLDTTDIKKRELEKEGIYCYDSQKDGGIVGAMDKMADRVSGRSRFTSNQGKNIPTAEIEITSHIPLFNFVVLVQGSDAELVHADIGTGNAVKPSRKARIIEPQKIQKEEVYDVPLYGSIATVDNGADTIKEGTYKLTFDRAVDPAQVIVLFEPALEIRLSHYLDGMLLNEDPRDSDISAGQNYAVSAEILEYGTGKSVELDKLPIDFTFNLDIENGIQIGGPVTTINQKAEIQSLTSDEVVIRAALKLDSYNEISVIYKFTPLPEPLYRVSVPDDPDGVQNGVLTATAEQLRIGRRVKYIDFKISTGSGKTAEELFSEQKLLIEADPDFLSGPVGTYDLVYPDASTLRIYPHYEVTVDKNHAHYVVLKTATGTPLNRCEIKITDPDFAGSFDPLRIETDEASLLAGHLQQFFVFTLQADGLDLDANDYTGAVSFEDPSGTIAVSEQLDNGKWKVSFGSITGKPAAPGEYRINAMVNGTLLTSAELSVTEIDASKVDGRFSPNPLTVTEAEIRDPDNRPSFSFTLMMDGMDVDISDYKDTDIAFKPLSGDLEVSWANKGGVWDVSVTAVSGKRLDPGVYEIAAFFRNKQLAATGKLEVTPLDPSKYSGLFSPETLTVNELDFRSNPQNFTFTLLADGKPLSADEINEADLTFESVQGVFAVSKVKLNAEWQVRAEALSGKALSGGTYDIGVKYRNASLPVTGKLVLTEQDIVDWSVQADPASITLDELGLRDRPQTFVFTLQVKGQDVNAEDYSPLEFEVLNAGQNQTVPVNPEIVDHKWNVKVEYVPGMPLGTYSVIPKFRNVRLSPSAELILTETPATVQADAVTVKQSELSGGIEFPVRILEGNDPVPPDRISWKIVDDSGLDVPADVLKVEKTRSDPSSMTLYLKVLGKLQTLPKAYKLLLSYPDFRGNTVSNEIPVIVEKSDYKITVDHSQPLRFVSAQDFEKNTEMIRFDITVDGRSLTDSEMDDVTGIKVSSNEITAVITRNSSGYDVVPKAVPGWTPSAADITYSVECFAGAEKATVDIIYHQVIFQVKCVSGDGTSIEVDDLFGNTRGLIFVITADDIPLTFEEVSASLDLRRIHSTHPGIPMETRINNDGSVSVFPVSHPWFGWKLFDYFMAVWRPSGIKFWITSADIQITLDYKNVRGDGTLIVERTGSWLHYLKPWLILIASIIVIILYAVKKCFGRNDCMYFCIGTDEGKWIRCNNNMKPWYLSSDLIHFILPVVSHQTEVKGLTVRAADYAVEFLVDGHALVMNIYDKVDNHSIPKVSKPAEKLEKGWHLMRSEDVIAVVEKNGKAVLYKYYSDR